MPPVLLMGPAVKLLFCEMWLVCVCCLVIAVLLIAWLVRAIWKFRRIPPRGQ